MLILALDSTAVVASVALCRDTSPIAAFTVKNGNTHSETLLPMVEAVLKTAGYTVDDVDLFACSVGPGSFTGVRIGAATIKGLAFGKGKPCAEVSALEALAENLVPQKGILCPVMNARRGQLYNALFRYENGKLCRLCEDRAISATDLCKELNTTGDPVTLSGDGVAEFKRLCPTFVSEQVSEHLIDQNAISVAKCAFRAYSEGHTCTDGALKPVYLRLPQAERERLERQNEKK